jgi:predicted phosphoribosyltransferase
VIVAATIAKALALPLDVVLVKKIGHPDNPEFAVGAVGKHEIFLNPDVQVPARYISQTAAKLRDEITKREASYRAGRKRLDLADKVVVVADDGIATGLTTKTAIAEIRSQKPSKIILTVPVAAGEALAQLSHDADDTVCLYTPAVFFAVGQFYQEFEQVPDRQVIAALKFLDSSAD